MDTNNYVESWHNHLKSHFLRGHTNCRGDMLIYILANDVDEFYQMMAMQTDDQVIYCIGSFSVAGGFYFVFTKADTIVGCHCQYFMCSQRPRRHMYLLHEVYKDNPDSALCIIHDVLERDHNRHAMIDTPQGNIEDFIDHTEHETEMDGHGPEDVTEALEILKKGLHDSDSIIKSPEVVKKLNEILAIWYSLPRTISLIVYLDDHIDHIRKDAIQQTQLVTNSVTRDVTGRLQGYPDATSTSSRITLTIQNKSVCMDFAIKVKWKANHSLRTGLNPNAGENTYTPFWITPDFFALQTGVQGLMNSGFINENHFGPSAWRRSLARGTDSSKGTNVDGYFVGRDDYVK
ncbi:hypothetical protein BGZ49_003418, partial [Haplosporangium sp. Z 27]